MRTLPDVFESEVLSKLTWLDAYKIACVNRECRETMEDIEAVLFMRTDGNVKPSSGPLMTKCPKIFISMMMSITTSRGLMCMCAAGAGKLDILKWLRQHKCPWDEYSLDFRGCLRSS